MLIPFPLLTDICPNNYFLSLLQLLIFFFLLDYFYKHINMLWHSSHLNNSNKMPPLAPTWAASYCPISLPAFTATLSYPYSFFLLLLLPWSPELVIRIWFLHSNSFYLLLWKFLLVLSTFTKVSNALYTAKAKGQLLALLFSNHWQQSTVDPSLHPWDTLFIWLPRYHFLWLMPYLTGLSSPSPIL